MPVRLDIPPCPIDHVLALQRELGVSFAVGQVLARRGLGDPKVARAWLEARDAHDPSAFAGIDGVVELMLGHVSRGSRITVHGDYDADGVCSTAILVRTLRLLGADVDWYLPSRTEDGYGLAAATVQRLAARGTQLLVTADCAITAVDEVAQARAAGMDVVVTDHHQPRADGVLPDAPIVHPALCGYPCADLCATGVAHKLAAALLAAAGHDAALADEDLDLVALATVADCVPLVGENRRLVRDGLRTLAATRKPGLRALMRVAKVDPGALDARSIGFRLAPRVNAAGRLYRADAGLELMLTGDDARAEAIASELDAANAERRHTETRILFAAEAQVAEAGDAPAYVLAGDGWHPGVIGIVASRIAERHHRPCVLIALDGDEGTGSGRSIPAFDLLGGLDACAGHLRRHGGHRAAAGCTIARGSVEAFRAAFVAHAAAVLAADDLVPTERVDAVVAGDELGLALAEELERLAPFGMGNPDVSILVPAARLTDARPMGEGKHIRFTVEAGGVKARAVAFGHPRLPDGHDGPLDATFGLELNEWNGTVEPRLVLRHAQPPAPAPILLAGEPEDDIAAALAELDAAAPAAELVDEPLDVARPGAGARPRAGAVRDRRGGGAAGIIAGLVASGEPVLVACADARTRRRHLSGRLGGFSLCSWTALEREPALAAGAAHVVALDPPQDPAHARLAGAGGATVHLAWGDPEVRFTLDVLERTASLRAPAAALYRALRDGAALSEAIADAGPPAIAGRALRVLTELGLIAVDRATLDVSVPPAQRTDLALAPTARHAAARLQSARAYLGAGAGSERRPSAPGLVPDRAPAPGLEPGQAPALTPAGAPALVTAA
ncbi:MAG: single-stranded-DNA-specific exonuclease [Solirubrobacteraceae bacterium]|nr:single-stranded-DNA-specific exonuclease [Solirubrobacteraceae bacterium]